MLEVIAKSFVLGFTLRLVKLFDVSLAKLWAQLFKRLATFIQDKKKKIITRFDFFCFKTSTPGNLKLAQNIALVENQKNKIL